MKKINAIKFCFFTLVLLCCQKHEKNIKLLDSVFRGRINNRDIILTMTVNNRILNGSYFYVDTGGELKLSGRLDLNDSIVIYEFVQSRPKDTTGLFKGKFVKT